MHLEYPHDAAADGDSPPPALIMMTESIRRPTPRPIPHGVVHQSCQISLGLVSALADLSSALPQRHSVEACDRQGHKKINAPLENPERILGSALPRALTVRNGGRVGHPPVRGHRQIWPDGAHFARSAITDRKDEIERESGRFGRFRANR